MCIGGLENVDGQVMHYVLKLILCIVLVAVDCNSWPFWYSWTNLLLLSF